MSRYKEESRDSWGFAGKMMLSSFVFCSTWPEEEEEEEEGKVLHRRTTTKRTKKGRRRDAIRREAF